MTSCNGKYWWYTVGRTRSNNAACNMTCPQVDIGSFIFISKGQAINWSRVIKNLARLSCVCVWAIGCSTSIPIDM